jgi:hypothetical protein
MIYLFIFKRDLCNESIEEKDDSSKKTRKAYKGRTSDIREN